MKVYVATFDGDICDLHPIVGNSLEECLNEIRHEYGFGAFREERYFNNETKQFEIEYLCNTPDPEDDKIEVWEVDNEEKTCKVVWGFWGWHHTIPEGLEQGKMPFHDKTLYDYAQ